MVFATPLIAAEGDTCHAGLQLVADAAAWTSARTEKKSRKEIGQIVKTVEKDIARFEKKGTPDEAGTVKELAEQVSSLKRKMEKPGAVKTVTLTDPKQIQEALAKLEIFPKRIAGNGFLLTPHENRALRIGLAIPILYTMALVPVAFLSAKFNLDKVPLAYVLGSLPVSWLSLPFLMKGLYFTPTYRLEQTTPESLTFRKFGLLPKIKRDLTKDETPYRGTYFATWSDKSGTFGLWLDEQNSGSPRLHLFVMPATATPTAAASP